MTGTAIVTEIISIMTAGLTGMGTAIGGALSSMATSIAFTGTGESQTLSVFVILVAVFAGLSLAFSLCRWVVNFLTSFGRRNR